MTPAEKAVQVHNRIAWMAVLVMLLAILAIILMAAVVDYFHQTGSDLLVAGLALTAAVIVLVFRAIERGTRRLVAEITELRRKESN